eukprot:525894_1
MACRTKTPQHCWLIVPLGIGDFLVIFSYILLSMQEYDNTEDVKPIFEFGINFGLSYRSFYDFSLVFTHGLIVGICCYYLWTNHEETQSILDNEDDEIEFTSSFMINFRKDSWSKLKAIYLYEMDMEWNEFNIAAIIFFIHQILTFILLLMNAIHQGNEAKHPKQDILTAFGFLIESLSIVLLSICLNAEHNPHFFMNRERLHIRGGGLPDLHSHHYHNKKLPHEKKPNNVMNNDIIIFMVLIAIICQFFEFLTYPSVNNDDFSEFIEETYNCKSSDINCSLRAHFIVNELIFRVFVGVTLLNLIFFLLSVLFGEHPHYPSFGGAKSLIRPCWFTAFLIFNIMELAILQDNYRLDLLLYNVFWMIVNSFSIILCCYHLINHIKLKAGHHNQWDKLNIATKYEGMLLLVLRTVSLIFVYLDEHQQGHSEDWTVYRQIIITITMYFHMITLWLLKKPPYTDDGVQFLLKFITYINAYNLIFSLIFETSHFLELLTHHDDYQQDINNINNIIVAPSEHGNQSYFLVSFSTSFAIAHSNLWFLSQYWEWTQKKSNRNKMSDSRQIHLHSKSRHNHNSHMGKNAIPLKNNFKQITLISNEYNTFNGY